MATNMLPILLLGGAAFYLLSRGGEEDVLDDGIPSDVESMDNVLYFDFETPMNATPEQKEVLEEKFSYPMVWVSSSSWPLGDLAARMKPTIEANPNIGFVFCPIDTMIEGAENLFGVDISGWVLPDTVYIEGSAARDLVERREVGKDSGMGGVDTALAEVIAFLKAAPATRDMGRYDLASMMNLIKGSSRRPANSGLQRLAGQ